MSLDVRAQRNPPLPLVEDGEFRKQFTEFLDLLVLKGWINRYLYDQKGLEVDFTPLGKRRMGELFTAFSELGFENLSHSQLGMLQTVALLWKLSS